MIVKGTPRSYSSPARAAAADETRARILAAARTLLGDGKGLPPFSLDGVAKQAGVTRLTVYNQFESKRGLLEAVFDAVAEEGGLTELPSVFAEPDIDVALRRFVSVFCRFWSGHGSVGPLMPRFGALAKLDPETAASLRLRTERRRQSLTVLVKRLLPDAPKPNAELVDVLFALTGFELFEALSARNRSAAAVEVLVQDLVAQTVARYRGGK
ncbi:MAG: TetR/AcrR family transcriptional regulator [Nevskia sp.]|nr:TetR/AcrR family transcriptional regulator [Nevskia sp.]